MDNLSDKTNVNEPKNSKIELQNNDIGVIGFSIKDRNLLFIYQKIKKLSAVLFRLSGMISREQVLSDKLKQASLGLISHCTEARKNSLGFREMQKISLEADILEILSFIEVASFSDLISPMNIAILRREFSVLLKNIATFDGENRTSMINVESYLKENNFRYEHLDNGTVLSKPVISDNDGVIKDNMIGSYRSVGTKEESLEEEKDKLKDFSSVAVKKNKRQSLVISLLKKKKEIMIKDLAGIINDCSEKTIQRELSALVESGLLKKTGERRWTRYSLAK